MILACLLTAASAIAAEAPPVPSTPAAVDDVLYARTFELSNEFKFIWSRERPTVTRGTLLVLKVDPALVQPRQIAMPVLYVGDHTAQRINQGDKSGRVIAIVPGEVDLARDPVWFGTPDFPHLVNAGMAKAERTLAEQAGIKPFAQEKVDAAKTRGGSVLRAANLRDVLRTEIADLILEFSPQEAQLAEDFRVPVLSRKKSPTEKAKD